MEGYSKFAKFQGAYPELMIYRRFLTLTPRNLLYLQAELNLSRNVNAPYIPFNSLVLHPQLATFGRPEDGTLSYLQGWLVDPKQGNYPLAGLDRNVWKISKDLIVLRPSLIGDIFTQLIGMRIIEYYHAFIGSKRPATDAENGMREYKDKTILRVTHIIGTIVALLMPVTAIIVLYSIHNMWMRFGMVAVFTVLLSLVLLIITNGKRIEVFAATAAFTSVQVIFVGSSSI
ncbi:hypothetical protein B0O99DRAFT_707615 [Bisporella sp. PMI_857]|nr:hypothetical protein B0O99DRAFT_707615 [Bisporella sp. PMI_857]